WCDGCSVEDGTPLAGLWIGRSERFTGSRERRRVAVGNESSWCRTWCFDAVPGAVPQPPRQGADDGCNEDQRNGHEDGSGNKVRAAAAAVVLVTAAQAADVVQKSRAVEAPPSGPDDALGGAAAAARAGLERAEAAV